jgi:hypothetical protein
VQTGLNDPRLWQMPPRPPSGSPGRSLRFRFGPDRPFSCAARTAAPHHCGARGGWWNASFARGGISCQPRSNSPSHDTSLTSDRNLYLTAQMPGLWVRTDARSTINSILSSASNPSNSDRAPWYTSPPHSSCWHRCVVACKATSVCLGSEGSGRFGTRAPVCQS